MANWSQAEVYQAALRAGFDPQAAQIMAATVMAENGGDPRSDATGTIAPGEYSVGPAQLNLGAGGHSAWVDEATARTLDGAMGYAKQLYDGNLARGGSGFDDWAAYTGGQYQQYLGGDMATSTSNATTSGSSNSRLVPIGGGYVQLEILNPETGQWEPDPGNIFPAREGTQGATKTASITGSNAPDPLGAVRSWLDYFDAQVRQGSIPWEDALEQFKQQFSIQDQAVDRSSRVVDAIQNSQSEAGRRAQTIARDILPSASTMPSLNVPFLNDVFGGSVPGTKIDVAQMFDQGAGPLMGQQQIQELFPAQPEYAPLPNRPVPNLPDIAALIGQGAQGFPGFQVMPQTQQIPGQAGAPPLPTPDEVARAFAGMFQ